MSHEHHDVIETVVTDVMEQMAFVFVDPAEITDFDQMPEQAVCVTLIFSGAADGKLTVIADRAVGRELAANLAGEDQVSEEAADQAIKEVVNVIAGQLLTEIAGTQPVFDLNPPESEALSESAWRAAIEDPAAVALLTEDQPLLVRFEMAHCPSM